MIDYSLFDTEPTTTERHAKHSPDELFSSRKIEIRKQIQKTRKGIKYTRKLIAILYKIFKLECPLNNTYKFISYLTGNTLRFR
jgi:hypothetical protein